MRKQRDIYSITTSSHLDAFFFLVQLAVHMKQVDGLCSPGASSTDSYVNVTLASGSSETVTFSAVPLKIGEIPITIQLYDREYDMGVDAVQKTLLVMVRGASLGVW